MSLLNDLTRALDRLDDWELGIRQGCEAAADAIAEMLTAYAKANHPWASRTGAMEASTVAAVELRGEVLTLVLEAGTDYAQFLELARGGRWAWLWEAVSANEEAIRGLLERFLVEKMR